MGFIQLKKTKYTDIVVTEYVFRLGSIDCWVSSHSEHYGWFRLFGKGLRWKDETVSFMFSERNGYKKYLKIGKWFFFLL